MAIKSRNKLDVAFNSSSMSDLVFLLLIFFMLTSTLVAPNAIKLMLPSSSSKTMAKQTVTVYINEEEKAAKVIVPDNQLSLAIGKEGQNARLAAKLTGWKIDIKSQSQAEEAMSRLEEESYGEETDVDGE